MSDDKPTLKVGDTGSDVHVLQALLGVPWLMQTGTFDDVTEYLVKAFQMASGLYPDGIVRRAPEALRLLDAWSIPRSKRVRF